MKPRFLLPAACSLLLAFSGCAGVTAEDIAPHAATARELANRNNAAIATHCVGMPELERQALIRDNIDHAAQLAALQESAGEGPGWISSVIAWALSFSRLAGIVVADPQADAPDEQAMDANDGNATEPETPTPDDDGDGAPDGLEQPTRCCPGCELTIDLDDAPAIVGGAAWHLECARNDPAHQMFDAFEAFGLGPWRMPDDGPTMQVDGRTYPDNYGRHYPGYND